MINDVTDSVRLEKDKIKKARGRQSTSEVQGRLDQGLQRHLTAVRELYNQIDGVQLKHLALSVKRTTLDLYLNFCQFQDLINIQNDSFL
jgi:hypothetical protein